MKYLLLSILLLSLIGCSKEEESQSYAPISSGGSGNGSGSTSGCSTINSQSTITHNGVSYKINALSGANNSIGIEVINLTGPFTSNYSMKLLQVNNSGNCYESTSSVEALPGLGKFFEFQNMPSWAINNSTLSKIRIQLGGTNYYIHDTNLDQ